MPALPLSEELQWAAGIGVGVLTAFTGAVWLIVEGGVKRAAERLEQHIGEQDDDISRMTADDREIRTAILQLGNRVEQIEARMPPADALHRLELRFADLAGEFKRVEHVVTTSERVASTLQRWMIERGL